MQQCFVKESIATLNIPAQPAMTPSAAAQPATAPTTVKLTEKRALEIIEWLA